LVPALVVGDESGLPDGAIDDLRGAGLGHLTAVSGANVASVLVGVLAIGAALGLHRRSLAVLAIATVAAFAVLARAEPSVLRAGAMAILAALASLRSGRVSGAAVLSASILVLVLLDPALALEPGFTLSVVATAGLLAAAGRIRPGTGRRRAVQAVLTVGVAALAAQAAVAPFVAAWSGRIDAGGLVANVVVAPLVPVITLLGLAAAVVAPAVPALAAVLVGVASGPASVLLAVAAAVSAQRWSGLPWPRGWAGGLVLAACLLVAGSVIVALRARHRWRAEVPPSGSSTRRLAAAGSALALVVAVVVVGPIDAERRWPPPGWRVVMCDAGQGDAVVLAGLADGSGAIVVDAGPDARLVDRCLRDLAVDHVALLVLTHFHADHAGGVAGVVRGRRVDEILVSPLAEPVDQARRVEQVAARASVPVSVAVTGAGARVAGWTLRVLGPGRPDPDAPSAPNDASIVLLADADGIEVLLLGDAEVAAQRRMLTRWPDAVRADVVKVAHHGSRVQDPQLLARTRAAVALVGVGCGNRYGHPAEQTLAAYRTQGAVIARTDRHGDVAVALTREGVRAIVRGPDPRSPSRTACR
jgi:competence protein ComEC